MIFIPRVLFVTIFSSWLAAAGALHAEPIKTPQHVYSSICHRIHDHPGDYPLPTDMTFKKYANHTIDQTTEYFDPDAVKLGDTIYLADWYMTWFVRHIHPKIKDPYILISNDSDGYHPDPGMWDYDEKWGWPPQVDANRTLLYDQKVAAWFCKNMLLSRHPKITQIPIGQSIIYWGIPPATLATILEKRTLEKKHLLYMNFQLGTNVTRPHVFRLFQQQPYCFVRQTDASKSQFYDELSQAMFTVAPPGYGPDTVRFWEAVLLGCIPIVKHFELDDLYADLPVLFVDEWDEVNEQFLKQKYPEILGKKLGKEKIFFDYWAQKIDAAQKSVREGTNTFSSLEATRFKRETLKQLGSLLKQTLQPTDQLLCKGAAMGFRVFELAQICPALSKIYVHDHWGAWSHEWASAHLINFTQDALLGNASQLTPISFYEDPYAPLKITPNVRTHFFLDLLYLRHRLEEDLENIYPLLISEAMIVGNNGNDPYVQKILERFARKHRLQMRSMGDLWFFKGN